MSGSQLRRGPTAQGLGRASHASFVDGIFVDLRVVAGASSSKVLRRPGRKLRPQHFTLGQTSSCAYIEVLLEIKSTKDNMMGVRTTPWFWIAVMGRVWGCLDGGPKFGEMSHGRFDYYLGVLNID